MAGFMSPGLGFSATIGSFAKGAAQAGSELLTEQRRQDYQNQILQDQIWPIKFDNFQQKQFQLKKSQEQEANVYKDFVEKGGTKLADEGIIRYRNNPKDLTNILNDIIAQTKQPGFTPAGSDYQSPFQAQQAETMRQFNQMGQQIYNRMSPKMQNQYGPFDTGQSAAPQPTSPVGQFIQNTGAVPGGQPQPAGQSQPAATTTPGQTGQPQPTPGQPGTAQPQQPFMFTSGKTTPITPYQQRMLDLAEQREADRKAQAAAKGPPLSPEDKQSFAIGTASGEDYVKNPKYGLEARRSQIPGLQDVAYDANNIVSMFQNGMKANSVQEASDALGRLFAPFGVDLNKLGLSNPVGGINEFKKNLGNLTFAQISQYHLGRWTNFEVNLLKSKLPSIGADPNTDIKIALALKAGAEHGIKATQEEYNAVYGAHGEFSSKPRIQAGREVAMKYDDIYGKSNLAPWPQINTALPNAEQQAAQLPPGTWFEDTAPGPTHGNMHMVPMQGKG